MIYEKRKLLSLNGLRKSLKFQKNQLKDKLLDNMRNLHAKIRNFIDILTSIKPCRPNSGFACKNSASAWAETGSCDF